MYSVTKAMTESRSNLDLEVVPIVGWWLGQTVLHSQVFGNVVMEDTDGNKCIKVAGDGHRLNADVVPCTAYRHYLNGTYTEGITFWTRGWTQIINFPKVHLEHGSQKNHECGGRYKPNVRVFKNARNAAGNDFPSYFLECLLYNVPRWAFRCAFRRDIPECSRLSPERE